MNITTSNRRSGQRRLAQRSVFWAGLALAGAGLLAPGQVLAQALDQALTQVPDQTSASAPEATPAPAAAFGFFGPGLRLDFGAQDWRYVLGAQLQHQPSYSGSADSLWRLKPMWGVRWGRWRLGTGGMGGLLGAAADAGAGASTDLFRGARLSSSLALRWENGRSSSDDVALQGLADVRSTVRANLATRYRFAPEWSVGLLVSQDLLGRGGGLRSDLSVGTSGRLGEHTRWTSGVGLSMGDARFMAARYGVPVTGARPGRPAYDPGGGVYEVHWGMGTQTELGSRWAVTSAWGIGHLQGVAKDSPLTVKPNNLHFSVGLVWRSQ